MQNRITERHVAVAIAWLNGVSWAEYEVRYFNGQCHLYNKDGHAVFHGTKREVYNIADAMRRAIVDNEEAKA